MRHVVAIVLLLMFLPLAAAQQPKGLDVTILGNILYCLQSKAASIGYAPPHFSKHSFKLRYLLNEQKEKDKDDELQVVVYGPSEKKGILYEIYFDEMNHQPSIYIGEIGTLKQDANTMVPDEIWGGVGTYYDVKRLLKRLASEPPVMVADEHVRKGHFSCVLQR